MVVGRDTVGAVGTARGLQGSGWWEWGDTGSGMNHPEWLPYKEEARRQSETTATVVHLMIPKWRGGWIVGCRGLTPWRNAQVKILI